MKYISFKNISSFLLILLAMGAIVLGVQEQKDSILDAGNHTSHSSSSHSSSSHSSSRRSSSSSSSSNIDFSSMSPIQKLLFYTFFHVFLTIHLTAMGIMPISKRFKNSATQKMVFWGMELGRFIIILLLDLFTNGIGLVVDFILVFVLAMIGSLSQTKEENKSDNSIIERKELTKDQLEKYGITDINILKGQVYEVFIGIEKAWMDFDYIKLQNLCTDELYNQYKAQLDVYKLKNEKNIMENFKMLRCIPYKISDDEDVVTLKVLLEVNMKDYIINEKTKEITSGSKDVIYNMTYDLTYVKAKKEKNSCCPNCGAPIKNNKGTVCEYCNAQIVEVNNDFKISDKVCLKQKNR